MASTPAKRSLAGYENLPPQVIARVSREVAELAMRPPDGIRYLPPEDDNLSEVRVLISGPEGTPYEEGVFHAKLVLGADYPQLPPRGFFLTKIYHPNISAKGEICVNTLKRDWTPDVNISHVLQVIRCLLIVPFPESSLNDEAGKLFMESYEEYSERARVMTAVHARSIKASDRTTASHGEEARHDTSKAASMVEADGQQSPLRESPKKLKLNSSPPKSKTERLRDKAKKHKQKGLKRL